jgi:hypothetical protein
MNRPPDRHVPGYVRREAAGVVLLAVTAWLQLQQRS